MELQNILNKRIKRKNFFLTLGIGAGSYLVMRLLPFRIFGKKSMKSQMSYNNKIRIKINPSAISRTKLGDKNGRS